MNREPHTVVKHAPRNGRTAPRTESGASAVWLADLKAAIHGELDVFLEERCISRLADAGVEKTATVLQDYLTGGKCVRSTFMYLGWLSGAAGDDAAVRAAASLELLHAFALIQDDVMDESELRRGRAAAHVAFASWHRGRSLPGSANRFGESAAVLLGDLCLVWSEQMLRESGLAADELSRCWWRYDDMRVELAVGQLADLVNDAGTLPTMDAVMAVLRRKSGNYTVRRPLELGAALAGCGDDVIEGLGAYGEVIGECFQLRDDLLDVTGSPALTGKPVGLDLAARKATSVMVMAHRLAQPAVLRELIELTHLAALSPRDVDRLRSLVLRSGAVEGVEQMIDERVSRALSYLGALDVSSNAVDALADMAISCGKRAA